MCQISVTAKSRIEAQGFVGLDDGTLAQIDYWLRLSPAICLIWVATGTVLGSAATLWLLVPFAALGAVLQTHPFDALYNHGLRHLVQGPRIPTYRRPRRFACLMATAMIAAAAWAFQSGYVFTGQIIGWSMATAALINVTTGFCVPSFLYGVLFGTFSWRGIKQPAGLGHQSVAN
jgi:hypothetical protein